MKERYPVWSQPEFQVTSGAELNLEGVRVRKVGGGQIKWHSKWHDLDPRCIFRKMSSGLKSLKHTAGKGGVTCRLRSARAATPRSVLYPEGSGEHGRLQTRDGHHSTCKSGNVPPTTQWQDDTGREGKWPLDYYENPRWKEASTYRLDIRTDLWEIEDTNKWKDMQCSWVRNST